MVTASIGIALATTALDPEQLLRNADIALYRAKAEGRGTLRWFETKMEANALARRNLELDLRHALESEAFELYYQPMFNLKTKRIRPARRCCAGRTTNAEWCRRRNSSPSPRKWG